MRNIDTVRRFGDKKVHSAAMKTVSVTTPILLIAASYVLTIYLSLGLLANIIIPLLTALSYLALWVALELRASKQELRMFLKSYSYLTENLPDYLEGFPDYLKSLPAAVSSLDAVVHRMSREISYNIHDQLANNNAVQRELLDKLSSSVEEALAEKRISAPYGRSLGPGAIELYWPYRTLRPGDVAILLESVSAVYDTLYYIIYHTEQKEFKADNVYSSSGLNSETRRAIAARLVGNARDILVVDSVHTGDSITIRLKTGWVPSVAFAQEGVVLDLPKGAACLLAAGYILMGALNYGVSTINEILKAVKTWKEIQQIHQKMSEQIRQVPSAFQEELDRHIDRFVEVTARNDESRGVEVRFAKNYSYQLSAPAEGDPGLLGK